MSGQSSSSSSSYGDTDTGTDTSATTNTTTSVIRWAPHGRALTAGLIAGNLALVGLIYLYFWRLFSRKRSASAAGDEEDASSSSASTPAPPPLRSQDQQREHDGLVASLPPTFVVRAGADEKGKGAAAAGECAVCIAELRDGDEARALPQCGHRFHAACVDAWLRRHTTCPLCRASVSAAVGTGAGPKAGGGVTDTTASAVEDVDAPV